MATHKIIASQGVNCITTVQLWWVSSGGQNVFISLSFGIGSGCRDVSVWFGFGFGLVSVSFRFSCEISDSNEIN